ncbi:MAG TPA: hypothetical protein VGD58_24690 [Herpetosiphonaceae bacterium]
MKLKALALVFALMLVSSTASFAAPKKNDQCVYVLGEEDSYQCFRSLDDIVFAENHILVGRFWDGGSFDGASLSIYNNDSVGSCGGGVPNLGTLGWDNRISSFANHCGVLTLYTGTNYCCYMSPGYGPQWVSIEITEFNNQASSFRW